MLLSYDHARTSVTDVMVVPRHFISTAIVERRKPLASTARRAGWVGCNIVVGDVPEAGKVWLLRQGQRVPKPDVRHAWDRALPLRRIDPSARGWLFEVLKSVEAVGRPVVELDEVYAAEARLSALYPANRNVRPKIRQQLQVLRDASLLEFLGGGRYRLIG